ncbi:hypothetical protein BaRGS_00019049 [Batillaria attramentaria]|uniref:Uncharacterized protein n=1 Tax=Batillaria attramentaria TaxID=370345 RepID=A0ABD0KRY9_9CAEN
MNADASTETPECDYKEQITSVLANQSGNRSVVMAIMEFREHGSPSSTCPATVFVYTGYALVADGKSLHQDSKTLSDMPSFIPRPLKTLTFFTLRQIHLPLGSPSAYKSLATRSRQISRFPPLPSYRPFN